MNSQGFRHTLLRRTRIPIPPSQLFKSSQIDPRSITLLFLYVNSYPSVIISAMIQVSFQTATTAIAQIFLMGAVGYALARGNVLNASGLKLLSWLSVNVCFPFFIFDQIVHHFDPHQEPLWWAYPFINIGLGLLALFLAWVLARGKVKPRKYTWMAVSGFHNAGYIPLLLVTTLPLGQLTSSVYACVILSIIGFDLCLWSLGVFLVTQKRGGISWRNFVNPPIMSMLAAFVTVLLGLNNHIPVVLSKPVNIMGNSALALAMITIGGNLGVTVFSRRAFGDVASAMMLKLIIIPVIVLAVIALVPMPKIFSFILMIQACMPTAITLSVIARHYETEDQDFINQTIFYTNIFCLLTIPIFLGLYGMLIK